MVMATAMTTVIYNDNSGDRGNRNYNDNSGDSGNRNYNDNSNDNNTSNNDYSTYPLIRT